MGKLLVVKKGLTRITSNTILVLFSLAFTFLLLELYFRVFDPQSLRLSRPDPVLGWNQVANTSGFMRKSCIATELRFNSEGMRDVEHSIDKPQGTYRIAVIGDSYVIAQEVDFKDTFLRRLEFVLTKQGVLEACRIFSLRTPPIRVGAG